MPRSPGGINAATALRPAAATRSATIGSPSTMDADAIWPTGGVSSARGGTRATGRSSRRVSPASMVAPAGMSCAATMTLPVLVVVGKGDVRSARDTIAAYLDSSGPSSVVAALEGGLYSACDSVRVLKAHVDPVSIAGIEYLAALLDVEVTSGKGL